MIDNENYVHASLTKKDYIKIESMITNLYVELKIKKLPISPFFVALKKGFLVIPYSKIDKETREFLRDKEISGMSGRNVNGQYKIIYDDADHEERQRFTVAHEIGHILLGHKEDSEYAEKCANYFASYFLVPTPMVEKVKCEDFLDVSDKFSVSLSCAVHAFDRYNRWLFFGGYKYKEYEIKMLENFKKIKNNI